MNRPNILYLHSHDTGRYIRPYGHDIDTPHLQQLADEGVLFRQAFCANPTCSPSRAALLTGQAAHSSGMYGLAHRGWELNDYSQHVIHTLHENGYTTALAGVQHIANHKDGEPWRKIGYKQHLENNEDAVMKFLQNKPDTPFFLSVGFGETHRGFPDLGDDHPEYRTSRPAAPLPDAPATRRDMAEYNACAKSLDEKMGRVLKALDDNGLRENTLVICTTDHGIAFPHMKCNLRDDGIGVMLIMRGPGGFQGGKVIDGLVSHVDIFPTICDLLEIERPSRLEGHSVLSLVDEHSPVSSIRNEVFAEVNYHAAYEPQRCVRTDRYKYVLRLDGRETPVLTNIDDGHSKTFLTDNGWAESLRPLEALYDLYEDPHEKDNRLGDPTLAGVLEDLQERLIHWMQETGDPVLREEMPWRPDLTLSDPDGYHPGDVMETHEPTKVVFPTGFARALEQRGLRS